MQTLDLLRDLIAFPTVSADSNRALIDYCADLLNGAGAKVQIIEDPTGLKANLFATIGPEQNGGVLLSGHTDVVPIAGQDWHHPAFEATISDGKVFGRGTTDMKGFVASAICAALKAARLGLQTPLHIALSYDEEIGCIGVRSMIDMLSQAPFRPKLCIVGEPTSMGVATGHKGKTAFQVTCFGQEAHSALAPTGLNAIYMASDMICAIQDIQNEITQTGTQDGEYDVAFTTLHVGKISGGTALNIVPNQAQFVAEIRNLIADDPSDILAQLRIRADKLITPLKSKFPNAAINIDVTNSYPPLDTAKDAEAVHFVQSLTGANSTLKVAFGTEGGLFDQQLGLPTVVCGPGSMAQGHKPDEFVSLEQLVKCDAMLDALVQRLRVGL
ncbi:MAG: acetylornithine deacetylase [Aliishimia sp.]